MEAKTLFWVTNETKMFKTILHFSFHTRFLHKTQYQNLIKTAHEAHGAENENSFHISIQTLLYDMSGLTITHSESLVSLAT